MAETTSEPTLEVSDLKGFLEWAKQFDDGPFLFRGVRDESYKIEPSAYRRLPDYEDRKMEKLLRINQNLIDDARLQGHDLKDGRILSDLELLAELQHFGAATCLIDFTRSALAALWFACQESSTEKDTCQKCPAEKDMCKKRPTEKGNGKVFAVPELFKSITPDDLKNEKKINDFFESNERGKYPLYQWQPKLQNHRIVAQQSVFVFGGGEIEASECVILECRKKEILRSLKQFAGINAASMFPDFEGFAWLHAQDKPYSDPDVLYNMRRGDREFDDERWLDAIGFYSKVVDHYETSPPTQPDDIARLAKAYGNRGFAHSKVGDREQSSEDLSRATELNPDEENPDEQV